MPKYHIQEIDFVGSFPSIKDCPKDKMPEYAFIGRSNVGKSSLINMLTNRKGLAKVSNTPGKTQLINFFKIESQWHLVDLPGYGYAKISRTSRSQWRKMINAYLIERRQLQCAFLLIDSRHDLQKIDLDFSNWMGSHDIPFVIVYTKADKLKPKELKKNVLRIEQSYLEYWDEMPQSFITSSEKRLGREEILSFIQKINKAF